MTADRKATIWGFAILLLVWWMWDQITPAMWITAGVVFVGWMSYHIGIDEGKKRQYMDEWYKSNPDASKAKSDDVSSDQPPEASRPGL